MWNAWDKDHCNQCFRGMMRLSVLSVCHAHTCALQKWLSRLRSCLGSVGRRSVGRFCLLWEGNWCDHCQITLAACVHDHVLYVTQMMELLNVKSFKQFNWLHCSYEMNFCSFSVGFTCSLFSIVVTCCLTSLVQLYVRVMHFVLWLLLQ